jgi:hypothetical protein
MAPKRKAEDEEEKEEEKETKEEEKETKEEEKETKEEEKETKEEEGEEEEEEGEDPDDGEYEEEEPKKKSSKKKAKKEESEEEEEDDDEDDEAAVEASKKKKRSLTVTLSRKEGTLGIAMSGNYVTAVHDGGAAAKEGSIKVGDFVAEVNGKDTNLNTFASLIPADKARPIKMRLVRFE